MAEQEEVSGTDASAHAPAGTGVPGTTSASSKEGGADEAKSEGAANEERANVDGPDGPNRGVSILFVGDLVGGIGRRALLECLPLLRERFDPTFLVVNGENVAGGLGITPKAADQLFAGGVDAITLGNHTYHRREIYPYLDSEPRILRPANFLRSQPGHGTCVLERNGVRLGVVNLSGNLYLRAGRSAFTEIEAALGELEGVEQILVDMHAEATSEKVAMGWHLDGRVTAVVGTHTHVPTADARVLPGGTAYITDVGMTGPRGGVIGVKREQAIESLLTQMPVRFETSDEDPWLMAVLIRCSATEPLRADSIEQILMPRPA
jgi:2',3'-cyclic-nucleotide 2'-phosphodiesterase